MPISTLRITTICVSLVLLVLIIFTGCTTTPSGSAGTNTITQIPTTTVVTSSSTATGTSQVESCKVQRDFTKSIYMRASNPSNIIDTVEIPLTEEANSIDFTKCEIVFTAANNPIILTKGTTESTSTYTVTKEPPQLPMIKFKITPLPAETRINSIILRPLGSTDVKATGYDFTGGGFTTRWGSDKPSAVSYYMY